MILYRDVIGQDDLIAELRSFMALPALKNEPLGHILLLGENGMGKATIAKATANELKVDLYEVDADRILNESNLSEIILNLKDRQVLFIDKVHLLRESLIKPFVDFLQTGVINVEGIIHRHIFKIYPFTLIAACPGKSDCAGDLLKEFSLELDLQPYGYQDLHSIAIKVAASLGITLANGAGALIARGCEGNPGSIHRFLQRSAYVLMKSLITEDDVLEAFERFGINVSLIEPTNVLDSFQSLSGIDFEELIAALLKKFGFYPELTKTSGDGGIDIEAILDRPIIGGRYLFQCKRYAANNLVGVSAIRDFYGAVTAERAVKGIFITTSDFTAQARHFGEKVGIELIHRRRLQRLLGEYDLLSPQKNR